MRTVDLVSEAERIVKACAEDERSAKKKDAAFDILLNIVMGLSCATLAAVLALNLL